MLSNRRIACLLTTWNRPKLLAQSLPQVEWEAAANKIPLVISDDHSDDPRTLALLQRAGVRGADIINPSVRNKAYIPHIRCGMNHLNAFRYLIRQGYTHVIKCDDDIALMPGAFAEMIKAWDIACYVRDCTPMACSGMIGIYQSELPGQTSSNEFRICDAACNVTVMFSLHDWKRILDRKIDKKIITQGHDSYFVWNYAKEKNNDRRSMIATKENVVYHTGLSGTHLLNQDVNREFAGNMSWVVTDRISRAEWRRRYAHTKINHKTGKFDPKGKATGMPFDEMQREEAKAAKKRKK
jgi:hypothetical protein